MFRFHSPELLVEIWFNNIATRKKEKPLYEIIIIEIYHTPVVVAIWASDFSS